MLNFHLVKTVFLKELKEIWRDKKTLFWIVLSPMFLYPFMIVLVGQFSGAQSEKLKSTEIPVFVSEQLSATPLLDSLTNIEQFKVTLTSGNEIKDSLGKGVFVFSETNFQEAIHQNRSVPVKVYYDKTNDYSTFAKNKIERILSGINDTLLNQRLAKFSYDRSFISPIQPEYENVAPDEKTFGSMIGKFLPGIVLFFIFLGAVYIALDLTAGEKERRTLQSLYASPIRPHEIVLGKFLPVYTISLASAFANLLGLGFALVWQASLAEEAFGGISFSMSAPEWSWIIVLLLITTAFISAIAMAVLALAKTYKEATSYMTPLMMLLIIPMIIYSLPAMEINGTTIAIPVLNVLLAMNELFKGTAETSQLIIVAASSLGYTVLALYLVKNIFSNESVITGEKVNYRSLLSLKKENRKYFDTSEALLFFAVVLLLFLYIGVPLQKNLNILYGLPLSFIVVLGATSAAVIVYFKLNIKKALQLNSPDFRQVTGIILMAAGAGFPISYITSLFVDEQQSVQFREMMQPLLDSNIIIGLSLIALLPAIFEEVVFRGIVFHGLRQQLSKWNVIILSSLAFAVMHLSLMRLFPTFTIGLLLGYILWRGKSIYLCVLFHFLYNGLFFILSKEEASMALMEENSLTAAGIGCALLIAGLFIFNKSKN